jgi:tyrosinase
MAHNTPPGFNDWTVRISFDKNEMRESFVVHIFLKPPPEDPIEWIGGDGYVGSHFAYTTSSVGQSGDSGRNLHITEGFVSLNSYIAEHSGLHSFEPQVVKPYLKSALDWRVQKADLMTPIPVSDLTSLEVLVLSSWVSGGPDSKHPQEGGVVRHPDITHGRQGGAK